MYLSPAIMMAIQKLTSPFFVPAAGMFWRAATERSPARLGVRRATSPFPAITTKTAAQTLRSTVMELGGYSAVRIMATRQHRSAFRRIFQSQQHINLDFAESLGMSINYSFSTPQDIAWFHVMQP